MRQLYADLLLGQEEPELGDNEIAYHLARLLGQDQALIHSVLVKLNPVLISTEREWYLSAEALPAVAARLSEALAAEKTPGPDAAAHV